MLALVNSQVMFQSGISLCLTFHADEPLHADTVRAVSIRHQPVSDIPHVPDGKGGYTVIQRVSIRHQPVSDIPRTPINPINLCL